MIIIESSDFAQKSLQKNNLLGYKDLDASQKNAYDFFTEQIKNDNYIPGRNKPSYLNNNNYKKDFEERNLWHYHSGNIIEPITNKPNNYKKNGCAKYWYANGLTNFLTTNIKNTNNDGLVCDFLIHYTIIGNIIYIYCASTHGKWGDIKTNT